tara:strand:+ start:127 stop:564 length:438 start_codon:yes stop_codon:yes gene_type:complete
MRTEMQKEILKMKPKNIDYEFLQVIVDEPKSKPHAEQVKQLDALLTRFPNFEDDYVDTFKQLSSICVDINHRLVLEVMRKSKKFREIRKEPYKFCAGPLEGILSRYVSFKFGEKLKMKFKFIPITFKGKGFYTRAQAEALGVEYE